MPFSIEAVPPEWVLVRIGLVVSPAVGVFEYIGAQFALLCFEMRWVQFFVRLAAPPKFLVIL